MTVLVYPAHVASTGDGLSARFVDLPVSVTAADAPALLHAARSALEAELLRRASGEDAWPEPTPMDRAAPAAGEWLILVDVKMEDAPVRVTISLSERLLARIDREAEARSMTRSGYLALGARRLLESGGATGAGAGPGVWARDGVQDELAAMGRRFNDALGPDSPVGRTLAELDGLALQGLRRLGGNVRSAWRTERGERPPVSPEREPSRPRAGEPGWKEPNA